VIIGEGRDVSIETLPRQEALEKCGAYLEAILPHTLAKLRVITIEGLDSNLCIGLHVKNV
jgi:Ser-tRNA(Ala) deacylase AlaX